MKRLIVLCDGTLEDADAEKNTELYTNIGRLSRAIEEGDKRGSVEIEQIKLYVGGVGTEDGKVGGIVSGAFGTGIMDTVRNIYSFLSLNWESGDEVFLFGFSRGAYTVRLVASLISVIGILHPRRTMHLFPALFEALDNRTGDDPRNDAKSATKITKILAEYAQDKRKQDEEYARKGKFLIKAMGLFDCVASRGRPAALRRTPDDSVPRFDSFGFDETRLESIIEHAYHALALDEHRIDYVAVLWRSDPMGRPKGQKLQQVWFTGAHADVGGGYKTGDLGYISLWWIVSKVNKMLKIDVDFLKEMCKKTVEDYGKMAAHVSRIGEFLLAKSIDRPIPTAINHLTEEYLHSSIKLQPSTNLRPAVRNVLSNQSLFLPLEPLEIDLKVSWPAPSETDSMTLSKRFLRSGTQEKAPQRQSTSSTQPLVSEKPLHPNLSDEELSEKPSSTNPTPPVDPHANSDLFDEDDDDPFDVSPFVYRENLERLQPNEYPPRHRILGNPFKAMRRDLRAWEEKRRAKRGLKEERKTLSEENTRWG